MNEEGNKMAPSEVGNTKKTVTKEKINGLARLAGSVKLKEKIDIQEIMREIRGK